MMRKVLFLCFFAMVGLMTSCNTIVGDFAESLLEYDMQQGLDYMEKVGMKPRQSKKNTKELQRLEKEGKCLTCRGIGKSIDGKYNCPKCNGTGLASRPSKNDKIITSNQ